MSDARQNDLERVVAEMTLALRNIKNHQDCDRDTWLGEGEGPCQCPVCTATAALETASTWRYEGALAYRVSTHPREKKIIDAWAAQVSDERLYQILGERASDRYANAPSIRDWYVATSVVQWLATNVGMGVLEAAGFKYLEYDADRDLREGVEDAKKHPAAASLERLRGGRWALINKRSQVLAVGTKAELAAYAQTLAEVVAGLPDDGDERCPDCRRPYGIDGCRTREEVDVRDVISRNSEAKQNCREHAAKAAEAEIDVPRTL